MNEIKTLSIINELIEAIETKDVFNYKKIRVYWEKGKCFIESRKNTRVLTDCTIKDIVNQMILAYLEVL